MSGKTLDETDRVITPKTIANRWGTTPQRVWAMVSLLGLRECKQHMHVMPKLTIFSEGAEWLIGCELRSRGFKREERDR